MVREKNLMIILDLLMNGKFSRAELSRITGLTKSTVGEIIREMLRVGIIREVEVINGKIGRPAINIGLRDDWAFIAGLSIERDFVSVCLIDSNKNVLKSLEIVRPETYRSARVLQKDIHKLMDEIINFTHKNKIKLSAIGVGMPGPFDPRTEAPRNVPSFPAVKGFSPKTLLAERYSVPVWIGNDADMGALGEKYYGKGRNLNSFIYVFLDKGIGSGIVINGELYVGISGYAGELGQLTVVKGTKEVFLEEICGLNSVIRKAKSIGLGEIESLRRAAEGENQSAIDIVIDVAKHIGCGIVSLIYLFGIPNIILGGKLLELGNLFLENVQRTIRKSLFHEHDVQVLTSELGNRGISLGAASYAFMKYAMVKLRTKKGH